MRMFHLYIFALAPTPVLLLFLQSHQTCYKAEAFKETAFLFKLLYLLLLLYTLFFMLALHVYRNVSKC